ncbi:probable Gag-Pol polyprotein at N-terminal half [Coccomyxa sp. Obi]|nr:probable Gag-Pol polyprotein at N-terminal half [Coccomyxa sp. Obi]
MPREEPCLESDGASCPGTDIAEVRTDDIEDDSWDVDSACSATSAKPADSPATKPAPKYVKGRLKAKLAFWQLFCKSAVVLSWISSGYEIPWALGVTPPPLSFPNAAGALQREAFVSADIADLLARGSIMQTHLPPAVISPLNVVERRGKLRLILDLVYVNRFIDQTGLKFKYENIRSASLYFNPDDYMFSVDLEAAYHHVDMHESAWTYLGFRWQGKTYVFTVLPFGLSPACYVFSKLTHELVGRWRARGIRLIHYLDDFLFAVAKDADGGSSAFKLVQAQVLQDIRSAGFSVSVPKLQLDPEQALVFLGWLVDLAKNSLTASNDRVQEFLKTLQRLLSGSRKVHVRLLARITGQLQSMALALGPAARIYSRALYDLINSKPAHVWNWHVRIDGAAFAELQFWQKNFDRLHGAPLWFDSHVDTVLFTDAGAQGWGGFELQHTRGQQLAFPASFADFHAAGGSRVAQGYLTLEEQVESSTWRELIAIERTLLSLFSAVSGKIVRLITDSLAVCYIWLKGSKKKLIQDVVVRIFEFCHKRNIQLRIEWTPRENNMLADQLSKLHDADDWMLNKKYFRILDQLWGPHTFDRFASGTNNQCSKFCSRFWCPGSAGVDAFSYNWQGENNWVNAPFALLGRVMLHMRACKAVGTVIVPWWPKQQWWHLVRSADGSRWAAAVRDAREINVTRPRDLFLPDVAPLLKKSLGPGSQHPDVQRLLGALPAALASSKADSTMKRYAPLWQRFVQWCKERQAQSLRNLSLATAISLGFCGFFRYDDLSHIRVNNLKLVGESLLEIRLDSRKNDQYREGSLIVLSAIESYSCPVKSVVLLLQRAGLEGSSRPLFSAVSVCDGVEVYGNTPASYQYLRRGILEAFQAVGLPAKQFGLHSLRAGGATQAANQGIPDRLWMEHGGWKSQRSAFGYVKTSSEVKAGVTQAMFPSLQP